MKADKIKKGLLHCSEDGCKGCNYEEACDITDGFSVLASDALRYIRDMEAAHRTEYCEQADYDCVELGKARKRITELEALQEKTAKWEEPYPNDIWDCYQCSSCKFCSGTRTKFCPNCGAKMEG